MKFSKYVLLIIGFAFVIGITSAYGDSSGPRKRILIVKSRDSAFYTPTLNGFVKGLQNRGYYDPSTTDLRIIALTGQSDKDSQIVKTELEKNNSLVFTLGTDATLAVQQAHTIAPCLFSMVLDPVTLGVADSLAHPGLNFTGTTLLVDPGKQLESLLQVASQVKRVGVLYTAGDPTSLAFLALASQEALSLGIQIDSVPITDYSSGGRDSLNTLAGKVDAFWLIVDPNSAGPQPLADTLAIASKNNLPVLGMSSSNVKAGALLALSANLGDLGDVDAEMACPLLDGSVTPALMPVRGPRQTVLSINLNSAKALGKQIPDSVLHLADEVIDSNQGASGN